MLKRQLRASTFRYSCNRHSKKVCSKILYYHMLPQSLVVWKPRESWVFRKEKHLVYALLILALLKKEDSELLSLSCNNK